MNLFETILIVFIVLSKFFQPKYTCKLDDMKLLASEACESLFREPITKRHSPIKQKYDDYYYNKHKRFKHFTTKCHIKSYYKAYEKNRIQLCKEDYPKFGYLLLDKKFSKMKIPNYEYYNDPQIENEILDPTSDLWNYNYTPSLMQSSSSSSAGASSIKTKSFSSQVPKSVAKSLYRDKRAQVITQITYCCLNSCRSDVLCK